MRGIVFERTPECLVVVRGREALGDAEWAEYMRALEEIVRDGSSPRNLVVSYGGSPTPSQRRDLDERLASVRDTMKVAILTESTYVRGVATAITQERPGFRVFGLEQVDEAIAYLGMRPAAVNQIKATLDRLTREIT